jgi:hypothetical protein
VQFPDDREPADSDNPDNSPNRPDEPDESPGRVGTPPCHERGKRHPHRSHARPDDRARHSRRSAVAERPQNIRPSSIVERSYTSNSDHANTHHGRRLIPEARSEENHRPYRGSHRAGSLHHADDQTAAQQRSSRVGRHHAESTEDASNRW